jgi:two-component system, NarL family, nitrate/nitrite response regulator NarL
MRRLSLAARVRLGSPRSFQPAHTAIESRTPTRCVVFDCLPMSFVGVIPDFQPPLTNSSGCRNVLLLALSLLHPRQGSRSEPNAVWLTTEGSAGVDPRDVAIRNNMKPSKSQAQPSAVETTRFEDATPAARENDSSDRAPHRSGAIPQPSQNNGIRLLLISDFLVVRAGLRHLLEANEITVVGEVSTCEDALPVAKDQRPEVILVDLDSSAETFACVQEFGSGAVRSRVIALSDRSHSAEYALLVELGAMGMVLKSEPPEVLVKAIRKVHAGEVWLDRANTALVLGRISQRQRGIDLEAQKIAALTKREHEIIALVGDGLRNAAIGERLFISESTVRNHLTSILDKLGVADRFELAVYAFKHGLVRYKEAERHHQPTT